MGKVLALSALLLVTCTLNPFVCDCTSGVSVVGAQAAQKDFLTHLAGQWMLESEALGEGFIGSTFPSETSPPHEVKLTDQTISFTADLQIGQGQYGQPIKETFTFTLEKAGENYLLSADSKSWFNLKQQKLSADATGAKGETKISLDGTEMTLNISIELTPPSGHIWDFMLKRADGKPARWFKLTFKPVTRK